jgi:hypothetical protein
MKDEWRRSRNEHSKHGCTPFILHPSAFIPLSSAFCLPFLLAISCGTATRPTAATVPTAAPPPPELSTIVVPIHTSLAPLLPLIESQVPKGMSRMDGYEMDAQKRFGLKYKVTRDPIALNMVGSGIHATTTVHYALEGCRLTVNPINGASTMWPCISCGFGEPMRDALIDIDAHLEWDENWRLRSKTKPRPVDFPHPCGVTFFNIDVSNRKIGPLVDDQLRDLAATIDRNIPKLTNLRPSAQQVWTSLQTPIEIAPKTWLVLEPSDVALGPIRGSGTSVASSIAMRAMTRVVFGAKPAVTPKPLPALRVANDVVTGMRVPVNVVVPYEEASRLLSEQFARRTYNVGGGKLSVDSIRLAPGKEGKLTIEATIDYHGGGLKRYSGLVYFDGIPLFDAASSTIAITGLEYSIDPRRKNLFVRTANRLAHDALRLTLRENAHWTVAAEVASMRGEIEHGMNRKLAAGVVLRGTVTSIQPVSVSTLPEAIVVRIVATGTAEVAISF